jgi:ferritin-like metal-binding protein YciE
VWNQIVLFVRSSVTLNGELSTIKITCVMPKTTTLHELLIDELKDLYSAETQLTKALPKMAEAANDEGLKAGFEEHLDQTREHVARLDRVMELLGSSPKGKVCKAMKGLVAEGEEKIDEDASPAVRDAALICAAQKVEHYEIAGYGTVRTFAELLGEDEVVSLLQETLDEEAETDRKLTQLASSLNLKAESGEDEESSDSEDAED